MGKIIDRSNQKFNSWTFIEYKGMNKWGEALWLCKCDCGYEKTQVAGNIVSGGSKRCMKCSLLKNTTNYKNEIPNFLWRGIKTNAKKRNIVFDITKEDALEVFVKQNSLCALSNIDIRFATNLKDYMIGNQTASLDRIDSSVGYIKDNIQWVHKTINLMKNVLSVNNFITYCKAVSNHHNANTN